MKKIEMGIIKNQSIRSFLGLKDKNSTKQEVTKVDVFCNKSLTTATTQSITPVSTINQILRSSEFSIAPVTVRIPLQDILLDPKLNKIRTCRWKLKLLNQWSDYVLIFVKLQYNQEVLSSIYSDIRAHIDYVQHLQGGGLLVHCKTPQFYFKLLSLVGPIYSIYMVISDGAGSIITIKNNVILQAIRDMNLQVIKYKPVLFPRITFTVWGIHSSVPQHQLIFYFRSIGKLVSWKFAPIGQHTKYHVIYLQYSRFMNTSEVLKKIKGFHSAKVIQNLESK